MIRKFQLSPLDILNPRIPCIEGNIFIFNRGVIIWLWLKKFYRNTLVFAKLFCLEIKVAALSENVRDILKYSGFLLHHDSYNLYSKLVSYRCNCPFWKKSCWYDYRFLHEVFQVLHIIELLHSTLNLPWYLQLKLLEEPWIFFFHLTSTTALNKIAKSTFEGLLKSKTKTRKPTDLWHFNAN